MYDSELGTKENKILTQDKTELQQLYMNFISLVSVLRWFFC